MPKYGFGVIADASTAGQQSAMTTVLQRLAALLEGRDPVDGVPTRYVLKGQTVPSFDKAGNPIQVEVEAGCALAFRSNTPRARLNALITVVVGENGVLPMATVVELGDAANDAIVERHLKIELQNRGCERWWGPLDRASAVPAPPVPLSNFAELTP